MSIKKIPATEFLSLMHQYPVFDVRSPGEYLHAHIPGAYSLPLFSDEERKVVGTAYKQQSRQQAIKFGLDFFGPKMRLMVESVEKIIKEQPKKTPLTDNPQPATILVHCWRGGMRSAAVAWLLDLYGFEVYTLAGGYKAYRNWVLQQFEKDYLFKMIGGYTGSGKTILLLALKNAGRHIIDLEMLAKHKGSALGGLEDEKQPRQEMFENLLAAQLAAIQQNETIFLEDESQRIGNLQIPMPLWNTMRKKEVYFFNIPFEERLNYLTTEYKIYAKEKLVNAIIRIQKRLGGLETKNAINYLLEDNHRECFRILLKYYDKYYSKSLYNREDPALIKTIPAGTIDAGENINFLNL
jgi:tRNA 2-selenouridine synthase